MPRKTPTRTKGKDMNASIPQDFNPPWMKRIKDNYYNNYNTSQMLLAKAAFPVFGGTAPETKNESSSAEGSTDTKKPDKTSSGTDSGGGDSSTPTEITPEQFAQLTTQVAHLTEKNTELNNQLSSFTSKEDEARRAAQGREETLAEDLQSAQKTVDQMDQIIKRLAVENAISNNTDGISFHNINDVISRLDHTSYELDVDLEGGIAKVSGIDNEIKRIAKENEYLVKKPTLENDTSNGRAKPRGTGAPPGPAPTNPSKANRRKELEAKWPVIASGRAAIG